MKIKLTILRLAVFAIAGCSQSSPVNSMTPDETFRAYNQLVIEGISFEDTKKYHSKAFVAKVEKQIETMQKTNDNSFEAFITLYLHGQMAVAKCAEYTLVSEEVEETTAYLVYDRKDICNGDKVTLGGDKIRLIFENGWKIDDNLTKMQ